jgi:hypothetical protein
MNPANPLKPRAALPRGALSLPAALVLLLAAGCATCPVDPKTGRRPDPTPASYMRVAYPDADTVQLQIAVRQFAPARRSGPVIWLAGASHIGEPAYYAALQRHLATQALVLYEGVQGLEEGVPPPQPHVAAEPVTRPDHGTASQVSDPPAGHSLQVSLGKALGLVFQLDALDYSGPQYRNSDLSVAQIQALMQGPRSPGRRPATSTANSPEPETEFQDLVRTMQGTSLLGVVIHTFVEIVGYSPRLQALTKLAMIEMLGHFKGDLSRVEALPPETQQLMQVLIQKRNQVVLDDLKTALKSQTPPATISVIYGAGHLADMEARVRRKLHYCPSDEFWLPVFSANTAGLTSFEVGLVRTFIRSQLELMQPGEHRSR